MPLSETLRNARGQLNEVRLAREAIPFGVVRQTLGASYSLLFAAQEDGCVLNPSVEGVSEGYGRRLQHAAENGLLPRWLRPLRAGTVVARAMLQGDHDFTRSEFFDYVVRPEGRFHCLISTPHRTPTQRFHLIVGRPFGDGDFSPDDVRVLETLLPYVGRLIAAENDAACAGKKLDGLLLAFDRLSTNMLVLSAAGQVDFANEGAKRILALEDGLLLTDAKVKAPEPAANAMLQQAIMQVTALGGVAEIQLQLPRPSGSPAFHVTVLRMEPPPDPVLYRVDSLPRAMLVIQQPDPEERVDGWSVARLYGLTPKEREVAVLLARGRTLRDVAVTLGIGYNTARSHLRRALDKTDTHRQGNLIRMILNASPRLRQ